VVGSEGRRLGIVIADVSGKGISAAILMAFIRPVVRAAMDHTGDPVLALERTNRILVEERPTGLLVTVFCGVLDLDTGRLTYANGGHEPPLVVRGMGPSALEELPTAGALLGAFRSLDLEAGSLEINPRDALVLYTDGVTDARSATERFGSERLADVLAGATDLEPDEVANRVDAALIAFEEGPQRDDVALCSLRAASGGGAEASLVAIGAGARPGTA